MSTWTSEKHEAARARCAMATEGPWAPWLDQDGTDHMNGMLMVGNADAVIPDGAEWVDGVDVNPVAHVYTPEDRAFIAHARADIPALLDEIARLRAESARRMVWLETAQRALEHANAALVDMTEHAAHPEITDDMVERAAIQMCATDQQGSVWAILSTEEKDDFRADARAALEAAHHHEGEPTAAGDSVVPETTARGES